MQAGEFQLAEDLGFVNLNDLGDRLQFDDDAILHNQVDVVPGFQLLAPIDERHGPLAIESPSFLAQLVLHALVVDVLEHTRTDLTMDADATANDRVRECVHAAGICQHAQPGATRVPAKLH